MSIRYITVAEFQLSSVIVAIYPATPLLKSPPLKSLNSYVCWYQFTGYCWAIINNKVRCEMVIFMHNEHFFVLQNWMEFQNKTKRRIQLYVSWKIGDIFSLTYATITEMLKFNAVGQVTSRENKFMIMKLILLIIINDIFYRWDRHFSKFCPTFRERMRKIFG